MEFEQWGWIIILFFCSFIYAWFSLAPWFPTKKKDLERIHRIADLKPGQKFLEIGCGDGRICHYISKHNPQSKIVGIELALLFYLICKMKNIFLRRKNCSIKLGNALKQDFSQFDVVYIFGLTDTVNAELKTKLEAELKPGAKFISYNFSLTSWNGTSERNKPQTDSTSIYVYTK